MDTAKRFERIFLATDGSEAALAAVGVAIAVAKSPTVKVKVGHVWNLEVHHRHGRWDVEVRSEAAKLVDETVDRLLRAGVIAEREILRADGKHVAASIACAARAFDADLVVIGSRGLSDWQLLTHRSVSHEVLGGLDCPVLIVRSGTGSAPFKTSKVLFAIGSGDDLGPGVRAALAVADREASMMVVHVAQAMSAFTGFARVESDAEIHETMTNACKLLGDAGMIVQGVVAHQGPVATAVAEIATKWNADLIVVGSSRMGGIGSLFLDSVSHDLLHMTNWPVLVAERAPA